MFGSVDGKQDTAKRPFFPTHQDEKKRPFSPTQREITTPCSAAAVAV
ncbi:MAG: hypothetical protein R3C62_09555 [Chloroflexota bacterium]